MRIEVYAMRYDESGIYIIGTAHSKKELLQLKYKATKEGFDHIGETNY